MNLKNKEKVREYSAALCAFITEFDNSEEQLEVYDYVLELMDRQLKKMAR